MVRKFTKALINGVWKKVETKTYNNGQRVELIYPIDSIIPEDIRELAPAKPRQVVNMEHALYDYWHGRRLW